MHTCRVVSLCNSDIVAILYEIYSQIGIGCLQSISWDPENKGFGPSWKKTILQKNQDTVNL